MSREGMKTLLDKVYHSTSTSSSMDGASQDRGGAWRVDEVPMVLAGEALYSLTGDAYTSTLSDYRPATDDGMPPKKGGDDKLVTGGGRRADDDIERIISGKSVLVLMNVRVATIDDVKREVRWIEQDERALCRHHTSCAWEIKVVAASPAAATEFERAASATLPSNVNVATAVSTSPFNKFAFVGERIADGTVARHDLVLLKDNDQRLSGFPWRTFLTANGGGVGAAVISGPLRQSADEALSWRKLERKRQWFQFHEAGGWFASPWSARLAALEAITPVEVPLLEMYFVLFDAKFAEHFFREILTPEFVDGGSSWGPDYLWCQAAEEWHRGRSVSGDGGVPRDRPGCHLVPVVSTHEDSRQIEKDATFNKLGNAALEYFKNHRKFGRWMVKSQRWSSFIGDKNLTQIEGACRDLLGSSSSKVDNALDIQMCVTKATAPE